VPETRAATKRPQTRSWCSFSASDVLKSHNRSCIASHPTSRGGTKATSLGSTGASMGSSCPFSFSHSHERTHADPCTVAALYFLFFSVEHAGRDLWHDPVLPAQQGNPRCSWESHRSCGNICDHYGIRGHLELTVSRRSRVGTDANPTSINPINGVTPHAVVLVCKKATAHSISSFIATGITHYIDSLR